MNKIEFKNLPDTSTPANADNLNAMQDNIEAEIGTKVSQNLETYSGDLNDIKTTGFTYARGTATNLPVAGHFFFLTTIAINENNVYQRATRLIDDLKLMYTYERQCVSGTWTKWKMISNPNITTGTEYETGRIIDGKKEYGKFINFGNLGNATNKTAAHGLTNVTFTKIVAHVTNGNVSFDTAYGYALSDSNGVSVSCNVQGSYVQVTTNSDRTEYTAVVELNYLKN